MQQQIIVIGGGAAGFMAAITAAETFGDAKVTILEKNRTVLNKVRISGGGRCNVTNGAETVTELCKGYPRGAKFLRNGFERFNNKHIISWFEGMGVKLKTEPDGRVFPVSNNSQTIIDCLLASASRANVEVRMSDGVDKILIEDKGFELILLNKEKIWADKIIVTTGGNPQLAAYEWLSVLDFGIESPVPSLFTFNVPNPTFHGLMGLSVPNAKIKIATTKLESVGPLLFTHWGLSGPAILKLSAFGARELAEKGYCFTALVNFSGFASDEGLRNVLTLNKSDVQVRNKLIKNVAINDLPSRLWQHFLDMAEIPENMKWAELPSKKLNKLAELLINCPFEVRGKTTFKDEFVTCGGIDLHGIDPKTMQSKKHNGLFFAGEVLDIDGITGGYNFQAAWTTGFLAGKNVGE